MPTQKKVDTVNNLSDKAAKSKSIVLADFKGLTHKQLEEIRKSLRKTGAELVIVKNRLMLRALGDKAKLIKDSLTDSTAALFSYDDEVSGIKALVKLFRTFNMGSTKAGILADKPLTDEEVLRLASLPNREVLLGQLVSQLQAPIRGLHYSLSWNLNRLIWALNGIKEKKS